MIWICSRLIVRLENVQDCIRPLDFQKAIKTTISPVRSRPAHEASNPAIGTAVDLERDGEVEACPKDVADNVACAKEDVLCAVGVWLSAVARTGSATNCNGAQGRSFGAGHRSVILPNAGFNTVQ